MKVLIIDDSLGDEVVADIVGVLEKYGQDVSVIRGDKDRSAAPSASGLLICGTQSGIVAALARTLSLGCADADAVPLPAQAELAGALVMSRMPDPGLLEDMIRSMELRMHEEKGAIRDLWMRGRKIERFMRAAARRIAALHAPRTAHLTRRVW